MLSLARLLVVPLALASATLHPKQKLIDYDQSLSANTPGTFSVSVESSASRAGERAQVDISINFSKQKSREAARESITSTIDRVESLFQQYAREDAIGSYAVDEFSISSGDDDDTYYSRKDAAFFDNEDSPALHDSASQSSYSAYAYARASSLTVAAFDNFEQEFANNSNVGIDWVRWSLSPDGAKAATREARQLVVKDAMAAGQDYADALGIEHFRLVSLVEESVYEGMDSGRRWRGNADPRADRNVTMLVSVKAVMAPAS